MKFNVLRFLMALWPALREALEAIKEVTDEDSPGGKKVTPEEAGDLAMAILFSLWEPVKDEILRQKG